MLCAGEERMAELRVGWLLGVPFTELRFVCLDVGEDIVWIVSSDLDHLSDNESPNSDMGLSTEGQTRDRQTKDWQTRELTRGTRDAKCQAQTIHATT